MIIFRSIFYSTYPGKVSSPEFNLKSKIKIIALIMANNLKLSHVVLHNTTLFNLGVLAISYTNQQAEIYTYKLAHNRGIK